LGTTLNCPTCGHCPGRFYSVVAGPPPPTAENTGCGRNTASAANHCQSNERLVKSDALKGSTPAWAYSYSVFAYVRRKDHSREDARDLTHIYFARLFEEGDLGDTDRTRVSFRAGAASGYTTGIRPIMREMCGSSLHSKSRNHRGS
jgi:hypothetical protein